MNAKQLTLAILALACVVGLTLPSTTQAQSELQQRIDSTAREPGQVESARSVVVVNELSEQAVILWIVPEGKVVKKGDLLVELDSSALAEKRDAQRIHVAQADASVAEMKARLDASKVNTEATVQEHDQMLRIASLDLERFLGEGGEFGIQLKEVDAQIRVSTRRMELAKLRVSLTTEAAGQNQASQLQVLEAEFELAAAQQELELAEAKKQYLERSARPYHAARLELAVRRAATNLDAARAAGERQLREVESHLAAAEQALALNRDQLDAIEKGLSRCAIRAPQDGMAVYPPAGRRADAGLEAGALVRPRQPLVQLPDLNALQIAVRVNESRISRLREGQAATVEIDALPGRKIAGKVLSVAKLPEPTSFLNSNVKEYKVIVSLDDPPGGVRIGMTALVEIRLE